MTLGELLTGAAHHAFGLTSGVGLTIESTLTAVGFAVIPYSLYAE